MNAVAVYQETTVTTQNPGKLIAMLYDGAIGFLRKAQHAIESRDFSGRTRDIDRARNIIMELNSSLDLEQGGQISQNLRSLYNYLWRYLGEANIKNDSQMLHKAVSLLDELGQSWRKIAV